MKIWKHAVGDLNQSILGPSLAALPWRVAADDGSQSFNASLSNGTELIGFGPIPFPAVQPLVPARFTIVPPPGPPPPVVANWWFAGRDATVKISTAIPGIAYSPSTASLHTSKVTGLRKLIGAYCALEEDVSTCFQRRKTRR